MVRINMSELNATDEKLFTELIRRLRPYLFDIESAVDKLVRVPGYGSAGFTITIKDHQVIMLDSTVTEKKKYV